MILPASYSNGFAPRDGQPLYPELWRGCVGSWAPCLGPSGLTLRDLSGFGNHGTLTNMDAGTDWIPLSGRYSLDFDGVNDRVATSLIGPLGASPRSFACWLRATVSGIIISYGTNIATQRFSFGLATVATFGNTIGQPWMEINGSLRGGGPSVLNSFAHVACVYGGGALSTGKIYVNGIEYAAATGTGNTTPNTVSTSTAAIGFEPTTSSGFLTGGISEIAGWNRALSANEVQFLATRRGIAYELAPRRRSSSAVQFNRRRRLLLGAQS